MRRPLTDKDGEVRELTKADMRLFKPIAEVDPGMVEAMKEFKRQVGRPKAVAPKRHIGFRLAADVVESVKASGPGYNIRVEEALRAALERGAFGREEKQADGPRSKPVPSKQAAGLSAKVAKAVKKRKQQRLAAAQAAKRAASKRRA
ncbi:MAG: BrnA antitoxin family protein [Hyphomicrobiales bacterium]|nr:BrnA antitoxin family protein [Hyphomicrobiales bacterium]MBV8440477.1 BrnA antitoxin family protein [Hyphomicrobiales bacterium]